jgi:hypothetical protein
MTIFEAGADIFFFLSATSLRTMSEKSLKNTLTKQNTDLVLNINKCLGFIFGSAPAGYLGYLAATNLASSVTPLIKTICGVVVASAATYLFYNVITSIINLLTDGTVRYFSGHAIDKTV